MPARVIAVLQLKGGAGRTTVALHVARGLQLRGHRTLIIDSDEQQSAVHWRATRDDVDLPDVEGLTSDRLSEHLVPRKHRYDAIVIDGTPRVESRMIAAIRAADLVIIPTQTSALDLRAAAEVVALVKLTQAEQDGRPKAGLFINRTVSGSRILGEARELVQAFNLPVLDASFGQRVAFMDAVTGGVTVFEPGYSGAARKEAEALVEEVAGLTGL